MQRKSQWKMEEELEKALAVEYAKKYCIEHGLSIKKLQMQRFALSANECCFAQPSGVKPKGLTNDKETMPKVIRKTSVMFLLLILNGLLIGQ